MSLKFVILTTDYSAFLDGFYSEHPGLDSRTYEEQLRMRSDIPFGIAYFYVNNLRQLGYEAQVLCANNEPLQRAWAAEHDMITSEPVIGRESRDTLQRIRGRLAKTPLRSLRSLFRPMLNVIDNERSWLYKILAEQIKAYKPDVIFNLDPHGISSSFLKKIKSDTRLLVGQIASPFPEDADFHVYDLMISSLPNFVEHFRGQGIRSELHRLAFEPTVLEKLDERRPDIPVSFIGSLTKAHANRIELLELLCAKFKMQIWGTGQKELPSSSPILSCYSGPVWGLEMFQVLNRSKMTVNSHIGIAESYANNMRLFEATGVGTLLITDWKENLTDLFEPDTEVVTYKTPEECAEKIAYFLDHPDEAESIARAGHERTLREHTYFHRLEDLAQVVEKEIRN